MTGRTHDRKRPWVPVREILLASWGAIHTRHRAGRRPGPWANGLVKCIGIGQWFRFYNKSRPHQALSYKISGGGLGG